jgi:tRNA-dihydrouridine synthase
MRPGLMSWAFLLRVYWVYCFVYWGHPTEFIGDTRLSPFNFIGFIGHNRGVQNKIKWGQSGVPNKLKKTPKNPNKPNIRRDGILSDMKLKLGLAPMEGVTDFATRLWFQWIGGMDFTWTPFLRVTDTFPLKFPEFFAPELERLKGRFPVPLTVQVMGSRPDDVVRTHDLLQDRVSFLDLNCGCPSPTVVGSRAGSSLLERADIFRSFIDFVTARVGPGRLSVKMRTGFHTASEFPTLLSAIADQPLRHVTVHGRTRPARYTGKADWNLVAMAAKRLACPVIGSGDLCDKEQVICVQQGLPKLETAMIGRGALRNPWIFNGAITSPVIAALVAFIVLQDTQFESPEFLINHAVSANDVPFGGMEVDDFTRQALMIMRSRGQSVSQLSDIVVSSRALSRGKMLWNYLRTSLPEPFMEPRLMRSSSLAVLIQGIEDISRQHGYHSARLPLSYRPDLDWMFSGEGRGAKPGQ